MSKALRYGALMALVITATIFAFGFGQGDVAENEREGRLTLRGVGVAQVEPDHAVLTFSARSLEMSAAEAMAEAARQANLAFQVLTDFGIDPKDIQTQRISLHEEWQYRQSERVFLGYRAEQQVRVAVDDLDAIGVLIDRLVQEADIESIQNIEFKRRDLAAAAEAALRAAYAQAEARAQILADEAGVTLLGPVRIDDHTSNQGATTVLHMAEMALAAPDLGGTQVQPGMLTVQAQVYVEFAYR